MAHPAADPFGLLDLSSDDDGGAPCPICRESLSREQTYQLPECKHEFHTRCITTWFRHRPLTGQGFREAGDIGCPYCGNKGINTRSGVRPNYCRYMGPQSLASVLLRERLSLLRTEVKKVPSPKGLGRLLHRYDLSRAAHSQAREALQTYKRHLQEAPSDYAQASKGVRDLRRVVWTKARSYRAASACLYDYPIVPLIIPITVDLS